VIGVAALPMSIKNRVGMMAGAAAPGRGWGINRLCDGLWIADAVYSLV